MSQSFSQFEGAPNLAAAHQGPLTVDAAARTLLSLVSGGVLHADTKFVEIAVETDDVRFTVQSTTPTATLGTQLLADCKRVFSRSEADALKLIRVSTDATIQVIQYLN